MFQQTTLKSGLTVASEFIPHVETISVGVFVQAGAGRETPENNGVAHFLEHMAFKGTQRRNAMDIAREAEEIGADMNAWTGREQTCYHMKGMKECLPQMVDILGDILMNSTFEKGEIERERGVILQELAASIDDPSDVVFDYLQETAFPNQPAGHTILGTHETVSNMNREQLVNFVEDFYTGDNMMLVAAGNVKHSDLVELVETHFSKLKSRKIAGTSAPSYKGGLKLENRDQLEQVSLTVGFNGIGYKDKACYDARVWATMLGGGMASRLFQEIREKRGLVYTVYAFNMHYQNGGLFGVYAGTSPKDVPELMKVLKSELAKSCSTIDEEELNRAKTQLRAGLAMSQESTNARMSRIANNLLVHGKHIEVADTMAKIDAVTIESSQKIGEYLTQNAVPSIAAVGAVDEKVLIF